MRRLILPTVAIVLVLAVSAEAADKATDSDRFSLWNGCRTMFLSVEALPTDAIALGLTREAVTVAVRSRLRAARLYHARSGTPFLSVDVNVIGSAFGVAVEYLKWVKDHASGVSREAITWKNRATGTHGRDASYILSAVLQRVDLFIDGYLRVNDAAC